MKIIRGNIKKIVRYKNPDIIKKYLLIIQDYQSKKEKGLYGDIVW